MTTEATEEHDQLVARTEATLEKFKEDADNLKNELGVAKAATKVQLKAMIHRLEKKYDGAKVRLSELKQEGSTEAIGELHQQIVNDLSDMRRTMSRRIL